MLASPTSVEWPKEVEHVMCACLHCRHLEISQIRPVPGLNSERHFAIAGAGKMTCKGGQFAISAAVVFEPSSSAPHARKCLCWMRSWLTCAPPGLM